VILLDHLKERYRNAKCLVLVGSHLGENMHNTQVQEFSRAVENHASIIVVIQDFCCRKQSKILFTDKPGTDLALLLPGCL